MLLSPRGDLPQSVNINSIPPYLNSILRTISGVFLHLVFKTQGLNWRGFIVNKEEAHVNLNVGLIFKNCKVDL